jgi:hypothetical protein
MEIKMKKLCVITITLLLTGLVSANAQEAKWYKGNTHCHTNSSDGDDFSRRVVRWYRDHNYNFIVITDHNIVTKIQYLDTDKNDDFILIQGEELTDSYNRSPLHVNALNIKDRIEPQHGDNKVSTLQNNIDAILSAGALPQINHPNWEYAFTDKEMIPLNNALLFELLNYSYNCNNFGAGGAPGMEEIWDRMLSTGKLMYGVASDDAHDYVGEFNAQKANPGTAWIMVRAKKLTAQTILKALETGDFYSTVGVILKDIKISKDEYSLEIEPKMNMKYTTFFIGKNGKILKEDYSRNPSYKFKGDELYVRAKVFASSGEFAFTQPVFTKK